jgi:hypothetical protein
MKYFKIILVVGGLFLFNSCEKDDSNLIEQSNKFNNFKTSFPSLASKINYDNVQKTNNGYAAKSENIVNGVTFPVMIDNKVIGRYMGTTDESTAIYIDFSDYKNKITFYDVNNIEEPETFRMVLDSSTNTYTPILDYQSKGGWRYALCAAGCTAVSITIALVDGPAPLMDVLAIAYQLDCTVRCGEDHL